MLYKDNQSNSKINSNRSYYGKPIDAHTLIFLNIRSIIKMTFNTKTKGNRQPCF